MESVKKLLPYLLIAIVFAVGGYFIGHSGLGNQEASLFKSGTLNPCNFSPTDPTPCPTTRTVSGPGGGAVVGDPCYYWPKGGDGWEEGKENAKGGCNPALAGKGITTPGAIMVSTKSTTAFKVGDPCQYSLNGGMDEPKWGTENDKGGCDPKALSGSGVAPKGTMMNSTTTTSSGSTTTKSATNTTTR